MAQFLNLAMAAKMAGVKRKDVQKQIRKGNIATFEGMIHVNELLRVYPAASLENTEMLDFVAHKKEAALGKLQREDSDRLLQQVNELRKMLAQEHHRSMVFAQIITDLNGQLSEMQKKCENKDKVMLETMMSWLGQKMDQNSIK